MHNFVHLWTIHVLNKPWNKSLARLAIKFVALHVSDPRGDRPWLTQHRLFRHAARYSYTLNNIVWDGEMARSCVLLGKMYLELGKLEDAEQMYERALRDSQKAYGSGDKVVNHETVSNLGIVYRRQGRLDKAEEMYVRALSGFEKTLGPMDTLTLDRLDCLGILYAHQGKLAASEKMFQIAIEGYEKANGENNSTTLDSVNNLGVLYTIQGKA
jgi:tetratricopeptide (TPR) repeat protein